MSSFRINTNIGALNAYNALAKSNAQTYKAQIRLATQKRINQVADDTSGFAVGKSLSSKVKLMESAKGNVGAAKDMLATAETQLISIKDLMTQIKTKISDASNPAADKSRIADDIKALGNEIKSIFANTKYNDSQLLVSSATGNTGTFSFQTGADFTDVLGVDFASGLVGGSAVTGVGSVSAEVSTGLASITGVASDTISALNTSLTAMEGKIDTALAGTGNLVQRLDIKDEFLTSAITNSKASVSRLFDADMAAEQLNATKGQISGQVATAMFSQLNLAPQNILQLFG
ncbi:MAG: flagellar biosynthesis protein FliC [Ignavibacteriae bacterium]|nr:flagellar biosynthesis protein FliC [Ignavibacteriota bacterium]NOG97112.1 flagellar biosynthesis protein FliC [Ignavibacteriota bacterium]